MPYPTPTSPTLADLQYNALNPLGSMYTTAFTPLAFSIVVAENTRISENMVPNFAGFNGSVDTSDFLNTTENVQVFKANPGPQQFSISTSSSPVASENVVVTAPFNPSTTKLITTQDTVVDAEGVVATEA